MGKDIIKSEYDTYWDIYERYLKENGTDNVSISRRKSAIRMFFKYLCGFDCKPAFENIKKVNLEHYMTMRQEKNIAPDTLSTDFAFLKVFFQFYKINSSNKNVIFDNWKYKVNKNTNMKILKDRQIKDLKRIIDLYPLSEKTLRTEICFLILTYTECTKDQLCSLNIYLNSSYLRKNDLVYNYILLDKKEIYFGKKVNNKSKVRMLPLNEYIVEKLIYYMNYLNDIYSIDFKKFPFLFPSNYNQSNNIFVRADTTQITKALKELINECKLISDKSISFKNFRHTFIKTMVDDEIPLQIIKELSGLELSSLKRYMDIEKYNRSLKETILSERHPYKILY